MTMDSPQATPTAQSAGQPSGHGHFDDLADQWWDPEGPLRTLHQINPPRMAFIERHVSLRGLAVVDVGCGAGILSEALAAAGARVTGIDTAPRLIETADLHRRLQGLKIHYELTDVATYATANTGRFAAVTCMELLEHVADPQAMVAACAELLQPGGSAFFSTVNRTPKAWLQTIVAGEHLLRLIPPGTHHYGAYIRPAELARWCREAGMEPVDLSGLRYRPWTSTQRLTGDVSVNYLLAARRHA